MFLLLTSQNYNFLRHVKIEVKKNGFHLALISDILILNYVQY